MPGTNTVYEYDYEDLYKWEGRSTTYDANGQILKSDIFYDNMVHKISTFENGIISKEERVDTGDDTGNGVKKWHKINIKYDDNGDISQKITDWDNGIWERQYFENGAITMKHESDGDYYVEDGVKEWSWRATEYDATGNITKKSTEWDNGVLVQLEYENGVLSKKEEVDLRYDGGDGSEKWNLISTEYDANGDIAKKTTEWDNGVTVHLEYENGALTKKDEVDTGDHTGNSAKKWHLITTEYDTNGDIAQKSTKWDNGIEEYAFYENGTLTKKDEVDTGDYAGDSAKKWHLMTTEYDANGDIAKKTTHFDNDMIEQELYEDGFVFLTQRFDNGDVKDWSELMLFHNEKGKVEFRAKMLDDGSLDVTDFDASTSDDLQTFYEVYLPVWESTFGL